MITRRRKITTAAVVLAIGVALAWPFRKGDEVAQPTLAPVAALPTQAHTVPSETVPSQEFATLKPERLAGPVDLSNHPTLLPPMPRKGQKTGTVAQMTGLGSDIVPTPASEPVARQSVAPSLSGPAPVVPQPLSPFVASSSHSVSSPPVGQTARRPAQQPSVSAPRPVYSIAARPPQQAATQSEAAADKDIDEEGLDNLDDLRIHVVHNGDTLQRLAKRYLDDERRALEIFDLNRKTLSNPHLLPIGTEIVIPPKVISPIDALQVK